MVGKSKGGHGLREEEGFVVVELERRRSWKREKRREVGWFRELPQSEAGS